MDPVTIAGIISAAAQIAKAAAPIIEQGIQVFEGTDTSKIDEALAELKAANEDLYARVQTKLRGA
jgi:hypothetical protein